MQLIVDFDALCFVEGILHLDIINGGWGGGAMWEHAEGTEGRGKWWRTEMTRQMADWRLSPWEETPGSQLEEGTMTRRWWENQSKSFILDWVSFGV